MNETLTPPADPATPVEGSPAEARHPQELFKYSEWLHVGPGAEECEHGDDGHCSNPMHFHAWCRLPNPLQHASIRDKAQAAKARLLRQYKDADSDPSVILEGELDEIGDDENGRKALVDEVVFKDFMTDYFEVVQEMANEEPEDGEDAATFALIEEDQERLRVIEEMKPEDRPEVEYNELREHIVAYNEEVQRRVNEREEPVRASLQDRPYDELRAMVRQERVNKMANAAYMKVYVLWEQYIGTLKPSKSGSPTERAFATIEQLKAAAPEVIDAIEQTFTGMDSEFGKTMPMPGKGS